MRGRTTHLLLVAILFLAALPVFTGHPPARAAPPRPSVRVELEQSAETGDTDILAADLTFHRPGTLGIGVVLDTTGVFSVIEDGVTNPITLGAGALLVADAGYTFSWPVKASSSINFQTSATGNVALTVLVFEDPAGP